MLLAKSKNHAVTGQPITIDDHTQHVQDEATHLLDARPFLSQKYLKLARKDLRKALAFCVRWHDAGKEHIKWQAACIADYELWKTNPNSRGTNLMRSGIRHEMDSLVRLKASGESYTKSDLVAIAAHHNKLGKRFEDRWSDDENFQPHWKEFQKWSGIFPLRDPASFEAAVLKRYLFDGPRALLQHADHRASAKEDGHTFPKLEQFEFHFRHDTKRGVQRIIEELWDELLAILRAPTGAGKTDAALLWAQHQIKMGRADRLVIAMPTRFTSNALAISAAENLAEIGVYHSTSYFNRKKQKANYGIYEDEWTRKENELARQLEASVTITTLDHLCICLTGAREDHHTIFWGLANSCVVIDEADFYDEFTQYNLVTLLRALRVLQVPVLIMSATVPQASRELYSLAGTPITRIYEDKSDLTRVRCHVHVERSMENPEDIADLLQKALDGEPTIIYANTVKRAQAWCDWFERQGFQAKSDENDREEKVFALYHSRFTEPDKAKKEAQLIKMLGKDAWNEENEGKPYGVAILTQIGELSVNISANFMISDLCPIDRLAQRAGRLARFGQQIGELHVVTPIKTSKDGETELYPAPYGEFLSHMGWKASTSLLQSQEWLKNGPMTAQSWIDGVEFIYPSLPELSSRTKGNQDKLEKSLVTNWMIVPCAQVEENDEDTKDWQSRNIPQQQKVYIFSGNASFDEDSSGLIFPNRNKFREWETETAITVQAYEVKQGQKNGCLEQIPIYIDDELEHVFIARDHAYSFARGLRLTPQEDETQEWED